ncbi:hypothetical protein H4582DRAFT_1815055, partial [Lactarius indigo]
AWFISEQHLFERLVTEIPRQRKIGAKHRFFTKFYRWSKISSKAMGDPRPLCQVASCLQKYFEKLKKIDANVERA